MILEWCVCAPVGCCLSEGRRMKRWIRPGAESLPLSKTSCLVESQDTTEQFETRMNEEIISFQLGTMHI